MTDSYGSTTDPPEKSIPVCTLKNFPYHVSHCIQWARDIFEGYFSNAPTNAIKFLESQSDNNFLSSLTGNFKEIVQEIRSVVDNIPTSYDECIAFGYNTYHETFKHQIMQLQHKYPKNAVNSDGEPFWIGTKKYPKLVNFDENNENHINFVFSFANLWAHVHGLPMNGIHTIEYCKKITHDLEAPIFIPSDEENNNISGNEKEENLKKKEREINNVNDSAIIDEMNINYKHVNHTCINPISFEKDDDTNYHIEFITAASNLRAFNYGIEQADKHRTKGIAGKIIPAIATTTALVSGLVMFELIKIIDKKDKLSDYRNWFCNLAVPYTGCFEPTKVKQQKINKLEFTFWDSFEFKNDPTVDDIINYYHKKYDMVISTITYGQFMLLSPFVMPKKKQERMKKHISELIIELTQKQHDEIGSSVTLGLFFDDDSDDSGDENESNSVNDVAPTCKVYF
jgi:ubiquitin-activating enzyme E1